MDTSKEYVRMCDCPEVQEGWKPEDFDLYAVLTTTYKTGFDCRVAYGISSIREEKKIEYLTPKYFDENARIIRTPRQDQIQEWLNKFYDLLYRGKGFWGLTLYTQYPEDEIKVFEAVSTEQCLLRAYMYEKHGKTWTGEKWE